MLRYFLVALVLLAGCVDHRAEREAIAGSFIGQSEAVLVQQAGPPTRVVEAGGKRFLVYEERRVDIVTPPYYGGWARPYGWGGAYPAQAIEYVCETSFEISDGKVTGYGLKGNAC